MNKFLSEHGFDALLELMKTTLQTKITGTKGQVVGFDDNGNPVAEDTENLDKEAF